MTKKTVFKINGMHCTACALDIDGTLEESDGIIESNTSYAKQQTEITFDPQKTTLPEIVSLIKRVGYEAIPLEKIPQT